MSVEQLASHVPHASHCTVPLNYNFIFTRMDTRGAMQHFACQLLKFAVESIFSLKLHCVVKGTKHIEYVAPGARKMLLGFIKCLDKEEKSVRYSYTRHFKSLELCKHLNMCSRCWYTNSIVLLTKVSISFMMC